MRLSLFFLLAALLIGCKSNTGVEPDNTFEPYTVGTWLITSETTASWIGKNGKNKIASADTVFLTHPDGKSLEIWKDSTNTNEGSFILTFIDSTYTLYGNHEDVNHYLNWQGKEQGMSSFGQGGYSCIFTPTDMRMNWSLTYIFKHYAEKPDSFVYSIKGAESDSTYKVYKVYVDGIMEVVEKVAG